MKKIELRHRETCWTARFLVDGQPDPRLVEAFGTAEIPTPFTERAPQDRVMAVLQAKNPGAEIVVVEGK